MKSDFRNFPGWELINKGLKDISESNCNTIEALLIFMAAPRLRFIGIDIPHVAKNKRSSPSHELYRLLENTRDDAYSQFNALQRRLISFCHAVENNSET